MTLQPGTRLGPYEILAAIGAGGMGEVWKARDTRLGRLVAIKRLTSTVGDRFEQEARAIAALNHPYICQIYDIGPDYLVFEYIEGTPLRGPVPAGEAVRLAIQMASALEEAHRHGIIHRDLKPANVLVTTTGSLKLLDFGLAKSIDTEADVTRTAEGTVLGTAAYMAPEQAEGRRLDARSDIFSFGAVLYELLSGTRAFPGDTTAHVLSAVLRDHPPPPRTSPGLQRLVGRCLEKPPEARFQTMAELRTALEDAARELGSGKVADRQPSIAVLPFADMSPGKDHEYFSDGLAEEIINALTHIAGLKVIARTSAFAFKGQNTDIRRIADALGVANIVEGSVRKAGNRIRVTAQLITATDGSHLWSERYDRELTDVFAIQDEIAQAIAAALQMTLSAESVASRRHTPSVLAYEAFLKARHYSLELTPQALARSRECCEQAIALDPAFALVHIHLGLCFFSLASENLVPAREAATSISAEARRALEIDPSLPEAHALRALAAVLDYNWQEAGKHFRLAMVGESMPPFVRSYYATFYLAPLGRMKEALDEIGRDVQEDPLNFQLRGVQGISYLGSGRDAEGEAALRHVLELDERVWIAHLWLSLYYQRREMVAEALAFAEKTYALVPANSFAVGLLAGILARTGDMNRAERLLQKLGAGDAYGAPAGLVCYHVVRSELDLAADWFEKAIAQRDTRAPWILPRIFGDVLTSSARWPKLAKMMNVPLQQVE